MSRPAWMDEDGWSCAGRLLRDDTIIRRLVAAAPHETTIRAVERYIAEQKEAFEDLEREYQQNRGMP